MKFDGDDVIVIFEKYEDIIKDIKDLLTILHTQYSKLSLMSVVRCNNRLFFTFIKNPKESGEADIITWVFFERRFCKFTGNNKLGAFESSIIEHNTMQYSNYFKVFKDQQIEILVDNGNINFYI
jgi:hypothetical protein